LQRHLWNTLLWAVPQAYNFATLLCAKRLTFKYFLLATAVTHLPGSFRSRGAHWAARKGKERFRFNQLPPNGGSKDKAK